MKIGVSYGSLKLLEEGILKEDSPTTLYLLTPGKCLNNCAFCTQARDSKSSGILLSRISWPPVEVDYLINLLEKRNPFKRICIQSTKNVHWEDTIEYLIKNLQKFNIPISISSPIEDFNTIERFLNLGVDKINLSLDVINKNKFEEYKGESFTKRLSFIIESSQKFPHKITTHIIIGLGEKEKEAIEIINELIQNNITIALFAFTPIPGTRLENQSPPDYLTYRKIQLITFLLKERLVKFEDLTFDNDKLIIEEDLIKKASLFFEKIFTTSGCPNCNRPYYNESPRITPYNFPRPLKENEIKEILELIRNNQCSTLTKR
ncbi:MAG: radical SAM protein [Dictyoglomus sp. NZ13-RE01]|nr:MAG: radical SAM protein [Dictyoglomus sp. NZ13-RE01]